MGSTRILPQLRLLISTHAEKLKMLKERLKEWSRNNRGNWKQRKGDILNQLATLEAIQEQRALTDDEAMQKSNLALEFEEVARNEEIAWRQRSRIQWLKQGDKNTKYFHRIATAHKRVNSIDNLKVDGMEVTDAKEIKEAIQNYYKNLYKEEEEWRPELVLHEATRIFVEEQEELQRQFEEDEILEGIKLCAMEKAPGPDGFPMSFYLAFWELIKEDILKTIQYFYEHQKFEKSLNATFIALIPKKVGASELKDFRPISLIGGIYKIVAKILAKRLKKVGASELKDFRPISLIGGIYKIVAKILAKRLKKVVNNLVNKHQMAFIKGRQIMDAALIASERVDSRLKGAEAGVMCKLDIEKAYDHVNWRFLLNTLNQMGFGEKWLKWIDFCIKTVKFTVLVNGEPVGFFGSERGLRQGNPLSPFLFILAMEGFDSMMRIALQNRWIKGFEIGNSRGEIMEVCHLQYADDTVIFCEPKVEQIGYIRMILTIFEASSSLKVNWGKTSLFPIKEVPNIQNLAIILGCKVENMPTTYLGGRLILINSVLDALPTYVMSLFPIPPKVMKKLDRLRRDFLWHGCKEGKGYKLVNWQTTMHSREQGGLGIRNLRAQNNSLLLKWLWRYNGEDHALWREVIRHKFGELNPWCTNVSTDTYGVGVWKTIRALWPKLEGNLQKRVGDGKRIKFWKDAWKEQSPLMEIFPDLFILSNNPDGTIYDMWSAQGWNLFFRRLLNDWEIDRVADLLNRIDDFNGTTAEPDTLRWKHNIDGQFSVKRVYKMEERVQCRGATKNMEKLME
ncbi:hypothetical protein MTR67_023301 [Solanum verrucosum]|uniref:Reverse transcriptase domain-containing protein n=1 Tax=Solanum verrucosum TaxID=315347 RepID=A0AAF0TRQ0_SOLVR|nr:hypothetical protein MTR67_023301 [Solanum verrucosum]